MLRSGLSLIPPFCLCRFLTGKPLIDASQIPKFRFQNDEVRAGAALLQDSIPQVHLSAGLRYQMDCELKQLVDVCELLSLAETARDFLLVTGGSPDDSLLHRMKRLRLAPTAGQRTLRQMQLKHADGLIGHLSLLRARRMILHKQNPFNLVKSELHEDVPDDVFADAVAKLRHLKTDVLLLRLHGFISEYLKPGGLAEAEGKLRDWMYGYLDNLADGDEQETEAFCRQVDERILNKHAIDLFTRLVVKITKENQ